jgi:hypothetical protein
VIPAATEITARMKTMKAISPRTLDTARLG